MSTRKPHRKSRTGCLNCKKRHMKCGEERPRCQNCFEYDVECQYSAPKPISCTASGSPPSDSSAQGGVTAHVLSGEINTSDLELLHHFTTSTYKSMSSVPDEQLLWQTRIIAIGLENTFLLRGILALSAVHLAYLKPPHLALSYLVKASTHQETAISQFRQSLSSITPATFDAVLAFSCLVPVHSIAMAACSNIRPQMPAYINIGPELNFQEEDNLSVAIKAVSLIRSMNSLLLPNMDTFRTRTLIPLLQFARHTEALPEADVYPGQDALDLLESACVTFLTSTSAEQQHATQIFRNAIAQLRTTFARVSYPCQKERFTIGIVLLWIFDVSDEYVAFLREKHPCALVVWAYFSTLLYGYRLWWLEGLGSSLVDIVSCDLGTGWWKVMEWPRRAVGLN